MKVYINCRNQKTVHSKVLEAIHNQSQFCEVEFVESVSCPTRLSMLKNCESNLAVFLDEDVVLPRTDFLKELDLFFQNNKNVQFLVGHYLSDVDASYLQRAYNWLTNLWMFPTDSRVSICQNAPGGFWALRTDLANVCDDWSEPTSWGGEDTRTIRFLQSKGFDIYFSSDFGVLHYPRSNLRWFLVRAFQQGKAKQKWSLKSNIQSSKVLPHLFKNLKYLPALFLHQLGVFLGSNLERMKSWQASTSPHKPEIK